MFFHKGLRVSRRVKLCKASWDLNSEPAYCFYCIILGTVSHTANPDSRGGKMPSFNGRNFNVILQRAIDEGKGITAAIFANNLLYYPM